MCDELGISNSLCVGNFIEPSACLNSITIDAILEAFSNPKGFMNRKGVSFEFVTEYQAGGLGVDPEPPLSSFSYGYWWDDDSGIETRNLQEVAE